MVRHASRTGIFLCATLLLWTGCRRNGMDVDVSGIDVRMEVERFDRQLFSLHQDSMEYAIGQLYEEYGDFFDVFNVHVIQVGQASSREYPAYLSMFINDPTNREVYQYASRVFRDMEEINASLTEGFRHYRYHYPDSILPRVVGYVSRFNQGLFTVDHFIGVGLDQYLGAECPYYKRMGIPDYLERKKQGERIPVDAMLAWATRIYPYNDSLDNVLNRMIYKGMLAYFVDAMFPGLEEGFRLGFTPGQMQWCWNNERQMWTYLVEEKLLFSTDPLVIRKLTEDAPMTQYYTRESPGGAAVWQGLQIVRAFAARNPQYGLQELLAMRDYQEVLRQSRYNP